MEINRIIVNIPILSYRIWLTDIKEHAQNNFETTWLKVLTCFFNKVYEAGRKVVTGFKESMRIAFIEHLRL